MTDDAPLSRARPVLGRAVLVGVVVASLAGAAALVGEPADRGGNLPLGLPMRTLVIVVDALTGGALVLGTLLVVAVVWALATAPRRESPRRRPWWHTTLAVAVLSGLTLGLAWLLQSGWLGARVDQFATGQGLVGPGDAALPSLDGLAGSGGVDPALRRAAAVAGGLAVLAGLGAWWWWLQRRLRATAEPATLSTEHHVAAAVAASLDDLDAEPDPRRAILRCYAHLDAALAAAGCPRRPAETAREHRRRAADTLGSAAQAATQLIDRFEHARYDTAPVGETDRRAAIAALRAVQDVLDEDTTEPRGAGRAGEPAPTVSGNPR